MDTTRRQFVLSIPAALASLYFGSLLTGCTRSGITSAQPNSSSNEPPEDSQSPATSSVDLTTRVTSYWSILKEAAQYKGIRPKLPENFDTSDAQRNIDEMQRLQKEAMKEYQANAAPKRIQALRRLDDFFWAPLYTDYWPPPYTPATTLPSNVDGDFEDNIFPDYVLNPVPDKIITAIGTPNIVASGNAEQICAGLERFVSQTETDATTTRKKIRDGKHLIEFFEGSPIQEYAIVTIPVTIEGLTTFTHEPYTEQVLAGQYWIKVQNKWHNLFIMDDRSVYTEFKKLISTQK